MLKLEPERRRREGVACGIEYESASAESGGIRATDGCNDCWSCAILYCLRSLVGWAAFDCLCLWLLLQYVGGRPRPLPKTLPTAYRYRPRYTAR